MFGFVGIIFALAGCATLATATTPFGQICALILWLIAAVFLVGHGIVGAVRREAQGLGKALAMHAMATQEPYSERDQGPPRAQAPLKRKTFWEWFRDS